MSCTIMTDMNKHKNVILANKAQGMKLMEKHKNSLVEKLLGPSWLGTCC